MRDIFRDSTLQQNFDRDGFVVVRFGDPDAIDRLTKLHDGASADQMTSRGWSYTGMTDDAAYRRKMSTGILAAYQPHIDEILNRCRAIFGNFFEKQPSAEESRIHLHQHGSGPRASASLAHHLVPSSRSERSEWDSIGGSRQPPLERAASRFL